MPKQPERVNEPLPPTEMSDFVLKIKISHLAERALLASDVECGLTKDDYIHDQEEITALEDELNKRGIPLYDEVYMKKRASELEAKGIDLVILSRSITPTKATKSSRSTSRR